MLPRLAPPSTIARSCMPGHELVGRLFLQRADLLDALERVVVAAFEQVELQQRAEQLPLGGLVGDVVCASTDSMSRRNVRTERRERRRVLDQRLELAVDRVGEARKVGGLVDARLGLRLQHWSECQQQRAGEDADQHGYPGSSERRKFSDRALIITT